MKFYTVVLDGIDKTGKDTIWGYIDYLSGRKYVINVRGVISQMAYSKLYNRNYKYNISTQKQVLNVLLTADREDWETRCKITNEPAIDYNENYAAFKNAYNELQAAGLPTASYNTSILTPYQIALDVIAKLEGLENGTLKFTK